MMKRLFIIFIIVVLVIITTPVFAKSDGVVWNLVTQIPSPFESNSWFPDLAVDREGRVHVVWSETGDLGYSERGGEGVFYSVWNGKQWMQYVDVIPPQNDIIRTSLAIDNQNQINLVFDYSPPFGLYYKKAPADRAYQISSWSKPLLVNEKNNTYYSDIAAFGNYLHIVYDDGTFFNQACDGCADIYYRNSPDGGKTWSSPVPLKNTATGSSRAQIDVDQNGNLYVAWDEGWDRLTGQGSPEYGMFMYSNNNGESWSDPLKVDYPNSTNMQLTVGADGNGGVLLVWRTIDPIYTGIYYIWSQDFGETWSSPQTLPNFYAKGISDRFDVYDMDTDSNGHIHLLAVGYLSTDYSDLPEEDTVSPGLYHFEWDGENWKKPTSLYKGVLSPEYPRLAVHNGNELHAVWFLRGDEKDETAYHEIWYASGNSDAPYIENFVDAARDQENRVSSNVEQELEPELSIMETPSFSLEQATNRLDPFSELDDYLVLLISMIPVSILGVFAVIRSRARG